MNNDDYENTLRAFELSQMHQKQRKPRTSNFLGEFDVQTIARNRLSIQRGTNVNMNTIQEDAHSSKSNEEDDFNVKSVTTWSEKDETKDTPEAIQWI